jgi:hypothetical protein
MSETTGLTVVHLGQEIVGTSGIEEVSGIPSSPKRFGVMIVVTIQIPPIPPINAPILSIGNAYQ